MAPRRSVERTLILSFAAVVLTFVGASLYGEYRASEIERDALSIQSNAAPSIHRLANARAELRRLQLLVHRALDEGVTSRRTLEIAAGRALLDDEIAEYQRLPMYSRETDVWQSVQTALTEMNGDVAIILDALRRRDLLAARNGEESLDRSSERVASRLSAAIDVNVSAASSLAAQIQSTRR